VKALSSSKSICSILPTARHFYGPELFSRLAFSATKFFLLAVLARLDRSVARDVRRCEHDYPRWAGTHKNIEVCY
jgi:hypothetical protein